MIRKPRSFFSYLSTIGSTLRGPQARAILLRVSADQINTMVAGSYAALPLATRFLVSKRMRVRICGKYLEWIEPFRRCDVAPHAGAWIETARVTKGAVCSGVAPHAGAWIETCRNIVYVNHLRVAPHAGAWIETSLLRTCDTLAVVAPHAGAWIETYTPRRHWGHPLCRPPRGGVD
jgi:hypothetical protein